MDCEWKIYHNKIRLISLTIYTYFAKIYQSNPNFPQILHITVNYCQIKHLSLILFLVILKICQFFVFNFLRNFKDILLLK